MNDITTSYQTGFHTQLEGPVDPNAGIEPTTIGLRVQRANHYTTKPHQTAIMRDSPSVIRGTLYKLSKHGIVPKCGDLL